MALYPFLAHSLLLNRLSFSDLFYGSEPGVATVLGRRASARRGATRASANSATRFTLRSRDPVERLVRDAVLSEKEAQLGRMFLHVTHGVQLELSIAHRIFTVPGEMERLVRLLV